MIYDLSQDQKKIARELIQKGLQKECSDFLFQVEELAYDSPKSGKSAHESYIELVKKVRTFDEHLRERYDELGESMQLLIVINLYIDGLLTDDDLRLFNDEVYRDIRKILKMREE